MKSERAHSKKRNQKREGNQLIFCYHCERKKHLTLKKVGKGNNSKMK